jgi:hypothetical protein
MDGDCARAPVGRRGRLPAAGDKVRTVEKFKKGENYRGRILESDLVNENIGTIDSITCVNGILQARIRIISGHLADLRSCGQYGYGHYWHRYPDNIEMCA